MSCKLIAYPKYCSTCNKTNLVFASFPCVLFFLMQAMCHTPFCSNEKIYNFNKLLTIWPLWDLQDYVEFQFFWMLKKRKLPLWRNTKEIPWHSNLGRKAQTQLTQICSYFCWYLFRSCSVKPSLNHPLNLSNPKNLFYFSFQQEFKIQVSCVTPSHLVSSFLYKIFLFFLMLINAR